MNNSLISRHLLWKDYRQVRPALIACAAILGSLMLLSFTLQMLDGPGASMDSFQGSYFLAILAPMLCALACSGMLIGHERQTRSWNWSSSLPITWSSSLISKSLIWFAASTIMSVLLGLLYGLLYCVCLWTGHPPNDYMYADASPVIGAMLFISAEAFILFSLAVLVMKESLSAMIAAGALLGALHIFSIPGIENWSANYYLNAVVFNLIMAVLLVRCFRWRWSVGQLQAISLNPWKAANVPSRSVTSWTSLGQRRQSSEWRILLTHSLQSGLALRCIVVASAAGIAFFWSTMEYQPTIVEPGFSITLLMVASWLLGASTFSNEQSNSRFLFYADRGVRWYKLLLVQILPPLIITVVLLAIFVWPCNITPAAKFFFVFLALSVFMTSAYGSLVSASPLMGALLGAGAVILATVAYAFAYSQWVDWLGRDEPVPLALFAMGIGITVALVPAVKLWLVSGKALGMKIYVWVVSLVIVISLLLGGTFAFLFVRNVDWQGLAASSITDPLPLMPQINTTLPVPQPEMVYVPLTTSEVTRVHSRKMFEDYRNAFPRAHELVAGEETDYWLGHLAQLSDDLDGGNQITPTFSSVQSLTNAIEASAVIGAWATLNRDARLAAEAWSLNARLINSVDLRSGDLRYYMQQIITSLTLRCVLNEDDWQFLSEQSELSKLVPRHYSQDNFALLIKRTYTYSYYLQQWPVRVLPPLRWYHQRQVALQLHDELQKLSRPLPPDAVFSPNRYGLSEMRTVLVMQAYIETQIQKYPPKPENLSTDPK